MPTSALRGPKRPSISMLGSITFHGEVSRPRMTGRPGMNGSTLLSAVSLHGAHCQQLEDFSSHVEVARLVQKFQQLTGSTETISPEANKLSRPQFIEIFAADGGPVETVFCSRFFDFLTYDELCCGEERELDVSTFAHQMLRILEMSDPEERFDHLMQIYDTNRKGCITARDLMPFIEAVYEESGLVMSNKEELMAAMEAKYLTGGGEGGNENGLAKEGFTFEEVRELLGDSLDELFGSIGRRPPVQDDAKPGDLVKKIWAPQKDEHAGLCSPMVACTRAFCAKITQPWRSLEHRVRMEWRYNRPRVVWLTLYIVTNILVFICKFVVWEFNPKYQSARAIMGKGICLAKAFAGLCTYNTGLIFFPISHKILSTLRDRTPFQLWRWIPFNDNIAFHILAGNVIMFASFGHVASHLYNFSQYSAASAQLWFMSPLNGNMNGPNPTYTDMLVTLPGWTGHLMVLIILIAYPTAAFLRRRYFNTFWYTHQLFILWTLLFFIHGTKNIFQPAQAFWVILPGFVVYLGGRLQRLLCKEVCRVRIEHAETFDNTTVLYVTKPPGRMFGFVTPGSYASINISCIARYEWHPFTISSAPDDVYVRFHIRKAGDWTGALWNHVRELEKNQALMTAAEASSANGGQSLGLQSSTDGDSDDDIIDFPDQEEQEEEKEETAGGDRYPFRSRRLVPLRNFSPMFIHGPYGAPTQDFSRYYHLVLIGAGIGVTPFASIIRHILNKWRSERCPHCDKVNHERAAMVRGSAQKFLQFHWVTREHESLSWFSRELTELLAMDTHGKLEVHQYLTGVKSGKDSVSRRMLSSIQSGLHCPGTDKTDIISGVKGARHLTHLSRPDFEKQFRTISERFPGRNIGVFYCGPPGLQNRIKAACDTVSSSRSQGGTKFTFHYENF